MSILYLASRQRAANHMLNELREAAVAAPLAVGAIIELIEAGDPRALDKLERFAEWSTGIGRLANALRDALFTEMQLASRAPDPPEAA